MLSKPLISIESAILKMSETPSFFIGDLPIYGRIILSPMDGVTDWPFRSLARRLGSSISYPEFINAIDVIQNHPEIARKLAFEEMERPVIFQLFDDDPDRMVEAAMRLDSIFHPDAFDINMGCPSKPVSGRGAGAGLLRSPARVAEIFRKMTRTFNKPVPGKIRIGWDDRSLNYLEIARIIEDNGGALIAVHGRTKAQGYQGQANWGAIAEIKQAVSIPVIGNGDVRTPADIQQMMDLTGCDGVMIARAAIENPWILANVARRDVPVDEVHELVFEHLDKMVEFYGPRGVVMFRKFLKGYLKPYPISDEVGFKLMTMESFLDLKTSLHNLFNQLILQGTT
jgi:tRNA-dihydrouridine synthase B